MQLVSLLRRGLGCSYTGADLAGTSRMKYPPNMVAIRVMCSGRVDPGFILSAFQKGADGVIVCGCHPGDCHYVEGNYKCMRRMPLTKRIIKEFGIDEKRLRLEWISASEGAIFQEVITEFTEQIREIGPLELKELNYQPSEIADKVVSEMGDIAHV